MGKNKKLKKQLKKKSRGNCSLMKEVFEPYTKGGPLEFFINTLENEGEFIFGDGIPNFTIKNNCVRYEYDGNMPTWDFKLSEVRDMERFKNEVMDIISFPNMPVDDHGTTPFFTRLSERDMLIGMITVSLTSFDYVPNYVDSRINIKGTQISIRPLFVNYETYIILEVDGFNPVLVKSYRVSKMDITKIMEEIMKVIRKITDTDLNDLLNLFSESK